MRKTGHKSAITRLRRASWFLLPIIAGWAVLAVLAHQTTYWAIIWTRDLFGWMLLVTYVCCWIAVIRFSVDERLMLFRAIASSFSVIVIVVCLELAAGMKFIHWPLLFEKIAGDGSNYMWAYRLDTELGYRRQPNEQWTVRPPSDIESGWSIPASIEQDISFSYDQWGYRNAAAAQQTDIALIGDSYIEGAYVSDDQTVASRLQARIGRPVSSLGVAGYGSQQELIVLNKDVPRYKPQVVVWFFFEGNDLYEDNDFENALLADAPDPAETAVHPQGLARNHGWARRSFTYALLYRLRRWSDPILPNQAPYFAYLSSSGDANKVVYFADYAKVEWSDWIAGRWQKTTDTLRQAISDAEKQGIHLMFGFIPIKYRVYQPFITLPEQNNMNGWSTWAINDLFLEFCKKENVPCLDLTGLFQDALAKGVQPYAAVDTHWSPKGHDLVAERLAVELCNRGWISGCRAESNDASTLSDEVLSQPDPGG